MMSLFSHTFKSAVLHSSLCRMSEPCCARLGELCEHQLSSQVVLLSVTARSIIASFTEKLFANPTNGSAQRLYLIENVLSNSILFRQRYINVILGYFKGIDQGIS